MTAGMHVGGAGRVLDTIAADEALAKHCVGLDAKPTGRVRTVDSRRQREWHGRFGDAWIDAPADIYADVTPAPED